MKTLAVMAITATVALMAATAQAQPVVRDGLLADSAGRTLYTFDKDAPNTSRCVGGCLSAWPAFAANPAAVAQGDFGLIDASGVRQWTVHGKPLYYFAGDTNPGERNGENSGGVWHTVPASAAKTSRSTY